MVTIRMVALLFLAAGLMPSLAYAKSDACCGDPLTCFCFKAENGDWLKGEDSAKGPDQGIAVQGPRPVEGRAEGRDKSQAVACNLTASLRLAVRGDMQPGCCNVCRCNDRLASANGWHNPLRFAGSQSC